VLARERIATAVLVLGAALIAVLWPLTAYAINPLALPSLLALAFGAALILRRPEYGLALVLALSPLINSVIPVNGGGEISLPSEPFQVLVPVLALGVLVYSLLVVRIDTQSGPHLRLLGTAVALFATSALVSSAQALEPSASLAKVLLIFTATILFFSVRQVCKQPNQFLVVVGGALAGLAIASTQGILDQMLGVFSTQGFVSGTEVVGRVQGSFGHPNMFGGFLAFLMPVGIAIAFSSSFSTAMRWLATLAVALAIPAMVFSYARGAMLGLFLGAVIWLALLRPRVALAIGAIVIVGAVAFAPGALKSRFENDSSSDVTLRSDIWNGAIEIYSGQPVFGVGLNNFQTAYGKLPSTSATSSQRRLLHNEQLLVPPHAQNIYLQALAEQGIVGLLAMLGVLIGGLVTTFRASRSAEPRTRALGFGLGIGLLGLMIHGMLEVVYYSETILVLFALLAVIATLVDADRASVPAEALEGPRVSPARA
jgi:O-antigen ligase